MKILVVCQHYWPENFRVTEICEALAARGHQVTALVGLPNYPSGQYVPFCVSSRNEYFDSLRAALSAKSFSNAPGRSTTSKAGQYEATDKGGRWFPFQIRICYNGPPTNVLLLMPGVTNEAHIPFIPDAEVLVDGSRIAYARPALRPVL